MAQNFRRPIAFVFFLLNLAPSLLAADDEKARVTIDTDLTPEASEDEFSMPRENSFSLVHKNVSKKAVLAADIIISLDGYTTIDPNKIAKALLAMSSQNQPQPSGLVQIKQCLAMMGADPAKVEHYPWSIDLQIPKVMENNAKTLLQLKGIFADEDGHMRIPPLPQDMATDLNLHLDLAKFEASAISHSEQIEVGYKDFLPTVINNIDIDAPVLVYYSTYPKPEYFHFYTIIGYKTAVGQADMIAVLDSMGQPNERIKVFKADQFFSQMDAGEAVQTIKGLVGALGKKKNDAVAKNIPGVRPNMKKLEPWGYFSYISFVKSAKKVGLKPMNLFNNLKNL